MSPEPLVTPKSRFWVGKGPNVILGDYAHNFCQRAFKDGVLPIKPWPDSSGWAAIPYLVIGTVAGSPGCRAWGEKGQKPNPAKTVKPTETLPNKPNVHCLMCPGSCALLHVLALCAPPHLLCLMCLMWNASLLWLVCYSAIFLSVLLKVPLAMPRDKGLKQSRRDKGL